MNKKTKIALMQTKLFQWFRRHGRALPWRGISDPYAITVSEIMLQQTQVDRVVKHFRRWLRAFPTWEKLARAQQSTVIRQWSGMGYNRRGRNLHLLAKTITIDHGGKLPTTITELQKLPGIGPYTARALMAFVWHQPISTVDVNISRLLHRLFIGPELPPSRKTAAAIAKLAEEIYPRDMCHHVRWNHALMDFGALICTARDPRCRRCPFANICKARPTIHRRLQNFYKTKKPTAEPGTTERNKYIPNRIFRGRIIEALRTTHHLSLSALGKMIKVDYASSDNPWLHHILEQLEKDDLIVRERQAPHRFRLQ